MVIDRTSGERFLLAGFVMDDIVVEYIYAFGNMPCLITCRRGEPARERNQDFSSRSGSIIHRSARATSQDAFPPSQNMSPNVYAFGASAIISWDSSLVLWLSLKPVTLVFRSSVSVGPAFLVIHRMVPDQHQTPWFWQSLFTLSGWWVAMRITGVLAPQ